MHRGQLIIPNLSRRHYCPSPQGLGPHWGTHRPACVVKPSWGALYDPKIDLQKKRPMRTSKFVAPCGSMVAVNRLSKASWPAWQAPGPPSPKFHHQSVLFCEPKASVVHRGKQ